MTSDEIRDTLRWILTEVRSGTAPEHRKLELKREWWDLSANPGEEEFAKDLAMLANTPGGDGIIVIGIDEKTGQVVSSPLA
ncbi:MAG: RNA-binding domain-containing protein [Bacteroidota bacterium]